MRPARSLAAAVGLIALVVSAVVATYRMDLPASAEKSVAQQVRTHATPVVIHSLPGNQVYPESVTIDQKTGTFYVGSVKEGTIFKGRVATSKIEVFSPAGADGRTMANGLFYAQDRLIVLGRQSGQIFVYDTESGRLITRLHNGLRGTDQTFLNDVTFAPDGSAYVTDSVNPVIYRVKPVNGGSKYELEEFLKFESAPITYTKAAGAPGININGIVVTADGRYLILAKRNENALFRLDLKNREVTPIEMPKDMLNTPDGMFLQGEILYVAQNIPKAVAVMKLSENYTRAALERNVRHPAFAFPTAVARYQNKLLVVSAQFDTKGSPAAVSGPNAPVLPFWVAEISAE
jgi:sugar lactone lactonase YvrE